MTMQPMQINPWDQRGFDDTARRFAMGAPGLPGSGGVSPLFRGLLERQIGQQQFPFALGTAMGTAPGFQNLPFQEQLTSPQAFERFLGAGNLMNPRQALRQAGQFLGNNWGNIETNPQAQTIMSLLTGPEGSVGSELFGPTIGLALQDAGRRFLPGLGQVARSATGNAIQNTLAQDPTRFQSVPTFINWLAAQGII